MKVTITGAAGFIGQKLARALWDGRLFLRCLWRRYGRDIG